MHHPFPTRRCADQGARRTDEGENRLDPGLVTGDARKQALLGPAAVAVHDDSDMARAVVSYRHAKALNPVRIERSRDAHRGRARSMGVPTSLDTNGKRARAETHSPTTSFYLAVAAAPT